MDINNEVVPLSFKRAAFGMVMPERAYNAEKYRWGFNGKENDNETRWQDYGFRMYYPGLGKFLSVDPLAKKYPELTTYQFASNRPIQGKDLDGLEFQDSKTGNVVKSVTDGNLDANDIDYLTSKGKTIMETNMGYGEGDLLFTKGNGSFIVIADRNTGREIGQSATEVKQFKNMKEGTPISNDEIRYYIISRKEEVFSEIVVSSSSRTNMEIIALTRQFSPKLLRTDGNGVPPAYLPDSKANAITKDVMKRGVNDYRDAEDMSKYGAKYRDSVPDFYKSNTDVDNRIDNSDPSAPLGTTPGVQPE